MGDCKTESVKKAKIYAFINGGQPEWYHVVAIGEDGKCLAGHISSNKTFAMHDIGVTSNWKHEHYDKAYPNGWEIEWVEQEEIKTHKGLMHAYELNQKMQVV